MGLVFGTLLNLQESPLGQKSGRARENIIMSTPSANQMKTKAPAFFIGAGAYRTTDQFDLLVDGLPPCAICEPHPSVIIVEDVDEEGFTAPGCAGGGGGTATIHGGGGVFSGSGMAITSLLRLIGCKQGYIGKQRPKSKQKREEKRP